MVNWKDPQEIAKDSDAYNRLLYALFGLYVWEIFTTFDFEWSFFTGRRKLRWPMIFFFLCRYCMLFKFIGVTIARANTTGINCRALLPFNAWAGSTATITASTQLMIRTIALWERKPIVAIPLVLLCVTHWALWYRQIFLVQQLETAGRACDSRYSNTMVVKVNFLFTIGFDFIILCCSTVALLKKHTQRSSLWYLLFRDGMIYFVVALAVNLLPAVLNILNLNPMMNLIATVPAICVSAIAACRCTIRLQELGQSSFYFTNNGNNNNYSIGAIWRNSNLLSRNGNNRVRQQSVVLRDETQSSNAESQRTVDRMRGSPETSEVDIEALTLKHPDHIPRDLLKADDSD